MFFKDEINLGLIYIGTLVGAGFASGQEIMSFFTIYGKGGFFGLTVSCVLFFFLGYFILNQSLKHQSKCIRDIMEPLAGKKLMFLFDVMVDLFCLAGYIIMLSGCGAVFEESMNLDYIPVVIFLSIAIVLGLKRGMESLAGLNKFFVSIIFIVTLLAGLISLGQDANILEELNKLPVEKGWLISALIYVSYNITLALVVLASLGTYTPRIRAAVGAAAVGAVGLFVLAFTMWFITVVNFVSLSNVQIPLLWVARRQGNFMYYASVSMLFSAMITTALSLGFSFVQSFSQRFHLSYSYSLNILFIAIPFTGFGFTNLISKIYPLMGVAGMFFAILLILRRFLLIKIE